VLLQNFAVDLIGRERFNLLIGAVFLVIVLFSTDGLLGWWQHGRRYLPAQLGPARPRARFTAARGPH
jgi:branched-chain amino acid transport system permease protein